MIIKFSSHVKRATDSPRPLNLFEIAGGDRGYGGFSPQAAGKIHSDMERGFIRAAVIAYDAPIAILGSLTVA